MRLSIITINKNNAAGLEKTAKSIAKFCNKPICEWIVIDGNSTDGSQSILENYKEKIAVFISESDNGIYDAMNKGVTHCTGDYVVFMNSGDSFFNLQQILVGITDWTEDIVYGDYGVTEARSNLKIVKQTLSLDFAYLLGKTINHQSYFLKKDWLIKYPFLTEFTIVGDWVQLLQLFKNEKMTAKYLGVPVAIYDTQGLSSKFDLERKRQRNAFLSTLYSQAELETLEIHSRLRQRTWYSFIVKSLNSPKRSKILTWISQIFG